MNYKFPKDFVWGVGASAFQIEGGMLEGGRTMNVHEADFYMNPQPRVFHDPREPKVNCDFYHKYPEDLKLLSELGPITFRYSISWSRIIPSKDAEPNQEGIDFYNKVIDTMIANGITPFMDLCHSDIPRWVFDEGGLTTPEFITWYTRYAEVCFRAFGDRVKYWATINEPVIGVFESYANARSQPYETDIDRAMLATHHMILAHFETVKLCRKYCPNSKIGMVNNVAENFCLSFDQKDIDAAERKTAYRYLLSDPISLGEYPKELLEFAPVAEHIPEKFRQEVKEKFVPMDFNGFNCYCPYFCRSGDKSLLQVQAIDGGIEKDGFGFGFHPPGMFDVLLRLHKRYKGLPIIISENGIAQRRPDCEETDLEPYQHDTMRQRYMREHIRECARLLEAGVNLEGYLHWTFMDDWELMNGFLVPMGLVGVDFSTLERRPRDSFYYYRDIIKNNMID